MDTVNESGLYNLFFRNCHSNENSLDLTVRIFFFYQKFTHQSQTLHMFTALFKAF